MVSKEEFESRVSMVPFCGCWIWTGALGSGKPGQRYGSLSVGGRTHGAHRVAYELYKGDIPGGLHVLHSCDVSECVNPEHLSIGTNAENIEDSVLKGRRKGVARNRPRGLKYKMTPESGLSKRKIPDQVRSAIKARRAEGATTRQVAEEFGVSHGHISRIAR